MNIIWKQHILIVLLHRPFFKMKQFFIFKGNTPNIYWQTAHLSATPLPADALLFSQNVLLQWVALINLEFEISVTVILCTQATVSQNSTIYLGLSSSNFHLFFPQAFLPASWGVKWSTYYSAPSVKLHAKAFRGFGIINFVALPTQCYIKHHYKQICLFSGALSGDTWGLGPWLCRNRWDAPCSHSIDTKTMLQEEGLDQETD